jgi:hypothetical protein
MPRRPPAASAGAGVRFKQLGFCRATLGSLDLGSFYAGAFDVLDAGMASFDAGFDASVGNGGGDGGGGGGDGGGD